MWRILLVTALMAGPLNYDELELEFIDMAISITTNRSGPYTGDDVTVNFAYGFKILADADLRVFQRDTTDLSVSELTLNVDYTVTGAGDAGGGNVAMTTAPTSDDEVVILRALTIDQDTDLSNQGGWFPEVHEAVFDYLTMITQDLQEQINRCLKIGETEDSLTDELAGDRAGYSLLFDTNGNPSLAGATDVALSGTIGSRLGTTGTNSLANGTSVTASGNDSRAQGTSTIASGDDSDASGKSTTASGAGSHAEGLSSVASGTYSHAEGSNTTASENYAHAEGFSTTASGRYSHAEGFSTTASGRQAHAEGGYTTADGDYAHAQGRYASALLEGEDAHATGRFAALGDCQVRRFILRGATTAAESLQLTLPEHFVIPDEHSVALTITVHGRTDTGAATEHFMGKSMVMFRRTGGTVAIEGAEVTIGTDIDPGGWGSYATTADDTNKCPKITVTSSAATNIRWVALIEAVQIGYSD